MTNPDDTIRVLIPLKVRKKSKRLVAPLRSAA